MNDEDDPVGDADILHTAYVVDGRTVSKEGNGRAVAGRVWGKRGNYVLVESMAVAGVAPVSSGEIVAAQFPVSLLGAYEADGTALAAFADGASTTPGLAVDGGEAVGVRWNNHATPDPIALSLFLNEAVEAGSDLTLELWAHKSGATLADATAFTVGAFFGVQGALYDADADCGGDTSAMVGNAAAKTIQKVTLTIDGDDVPAGPCFLNLTIQPKDGTLGTDDVTLLGGRLLV